MNQKNSSTRLHTTKNKVYEEEVEKAKALLPVEDKSRVTRTIGNTVEAFNSVPAAIYCFARNHQNYVEAVSYAVSLGGDTDTVGAMTGAIAGAHQGEEDLPKSWRNKLEKADYITELAQKLWKMKNVSCIHEPKNNACRLFICFFRDTRPYPCRSQPCVAFLHRTHKIR